MATTWREFGKFPWSVPLGSVLRIPVRLHVTFFLVLCAQAIGSIYYSALYVLLSLLTFGPLLLLTVLVHELGHCLAARSVGGTVDSILLWPLGGLAFISTQHITPKKAIWVAVAGPLTHIPMVGIWLGLLLPACYAATGRWILHLAMPDELTGHTFGQAVCQWAVIVNIALLVFNLFVPAYPLDGGRILANLLLMAGTSLRTAAIVTVAVALPLGAGLLVLGIYFFQMVTILVAAFILISSFQLFMATRRNELAHHPLFAGLEIMGGTSEVGTVPGTVPPGGLYASMGSGKPGTTGVALPGYPAVARSGGGGGNTRGGYTSPLHTGTMV